MNHADPNAGKPSVSHAFTLAPEFPAPHLCLDCISPRARLFFETDAPVLVLEEDGMLLRLRFPNLPTLHRLTTDVLKASGQAMEIAQLTLFGRVKMPNLRARVELYAPAVRIIDSTLHIFDKRTCVTLRFESVAEIRRFAAALVVLLYVPNDPQMPVVADP